MTDDPSPPIRKIIHVDMDAFYASVEQRDNPDLRGKPVAVGGARARGVVAAASYEARTFGVRSAMPSVTAARKCPDLVFVKPRFDVYRAVSQQIRAIFADYTPLIEPLSLDEAYLDVTDNLKGMTIATDIALEIRARIKEVTGLTASAGISYNKFLAKMASDLNKPNGQAVITPKNGPAFVEALPVKKFHGVGPATAEKMRAVGDRDGRGPQGEVARVPERALWQIGALLLWNCPRDRQPTRRTRSRAEIRWCRRHLCGGHLGTGTSASRTRAARQQGLAVLQDPSDFGQDSHPEDQVLRFPADHAQPNCFRDRFPTSPKCSAWRAHCWQAIYPFPKTIRLLGVTLSSFGANQLQDEQLNLALQN